MSGAHQLQEFSSLEEDPDLILNTHMTAYNSLFLGNSALFSSLYGHQEYALSTHLTFKYTDKSLTYVKEK